MAVLKRENIEKMLLKKCFAPSTSKDHRFYSFFDENGVLVARTKVSHGTKYKDINDFLIVQMAKQCHLSKEEFLQLIDCSLSANEYRKLLEGRTVD